MEEKEYEESEAIDFIRNYIGPEASARYTDDDLIEVVDLTFDFFEQFSDDDDIDIEVTVGGDNDEALAIQGDDYEALIDYVSHLIAKDKKSKIQQEDIPAIVAGEILYEETLS